MSQTLQKRKTFLPTAVMIVLLPMLGSCGSGLSEDYAYSVWIINNTDSTIIVRYDRDTIFLFNEWAGEETIQPGESSIIEWTSENPGSEYIEIEYQGIKKNFIAPQFGTMQIYSSDF